MRAVFRESLYSLTGYDPVFARGERPKILAAVSGGVDSMVMATLLHECQGIELSVASVNFRLRGSESEEDLKLVSDWCDDRDVRFHHKAVDTVVYAERNGISIEMAARDLRYNWFDCLMDEENYDFLAVAHNLNDSVETLILNLLRGTGVDGLSGIRAKNGKIIRPLLNFSRDEISNFAKQNSVPFREDSTNKESHYARNRIRNLVFPEFEKINPSFLKRVKENMTYFSDASTILSEMYKEVKKRVADTSPGGGVECRIEINKLMEETSPRYWLYHLLQEYGFNGDQANQVYESFNGQAGKVFYTERFSLVKDREYLLISKASSDKKEKEEFLLLDDPAEMGNSYNYRGRMLYLRKFCRSSEFSPLAETGEIQYMDAGKIKFPLVCRSWKPGDKFIPFGMKGYKKLSDYFTDNKFDLVSKDSQPVILSESSVVCLPGFRIDNRYRITEETKFVLEVRIS
jgi:tRNA(Ile)-lysidine synthase